jgi:hypothetical protein
MENKLGWFLGINPVVYFLINTCLTGLRSLGILSSPVVYLPALEGFEEFDDLPALVSEEFEEAWELPAIPGGWFLTPVN